MVNATLGRMHVNGSTVEPICLYGNKLCSTVDKISEKAHFAFEAFHHKEFETAHMVISEIENCDEYEQNGFGISITSYHKDQLDPQLNFIITELGKESKNGKSPRGSISFNQAYPHSARSAEQRKYGKTPESFDGSQRYG